MPDDQTGVKIQFHLFSSTDGRLTMLDLDAEQVQKFLKKFSWNYSRILFPGAP